MKPRGHRYAISQVKQLFDDVRRQLDEADPFQKKMIALIDSHELSRQEQLQRDEEEKAQGKPTYDALIDELRRRDLHELANNVTFADFRPKANCLYIRLAPQLRGGLIGVGGEHIQDLARIIGARITFERESR
jgi:hypothetical protein